MPKREKYKEETGGAASARAAAPRRVATGGIYHAASGKSERIDVRTTPIVKALLQRAAASSHKNVTEFLLEAGINAAEEALADRRLFRLEERQWQAFVEALDRPVVAKPRLARLLSDKSVLE